MENPFLGKTGKRVMYCKLGVSDGSILWDAAILFYIRIRRGTLR